MTQVSCSRVIHARPSAIWAALADFGSVSAWADGVDHSCLLRRNPDGSALGSVRRIQAGRDTFLETITEFEAESVLAYDISGLPPAVLAANRWTLSPAAAEATAVTVTSTVRITRGPLRRFAERAVARVMAKRARGLLESLAAASEGVSA